MNIALYRDLEAFHAWAMAKIFHHCKSLSTDALIKELPLGPGSLMATLQHMAGAERIWLDRWRGNPTATFPSMPADVSELEAQFASMARERGELLEHDPSLLQQKIEYRNLSGQFLCNDLAGLVLHVFNHAVHHRAQAAHFLKKQQIQFPGGLDYLFFRIAQPTLALNETAKKGCRHWGLEVGDALTEYLKPDEGSLKQYMEYHNWGMHLVFDQCREFSDSELDWDWEMGRGSIRKTLLHLYDAECFWLANYDAPGSAFPNTPSTTSMKDLSRMWKEVFERKVDYLQSSGPNALGKTVKVDFGSGPLDFRYSESLLQLCVHGTWHRAQCNNMLRSSGLKPKPIDYVVYLRELG